MQGATAANLGGLLTPFKQKKDFGFRVSEIKNGYLLNNFATNDLEAFTTLDEVQDALNTAFEAAFAPDETQTPTSEETTNSEGETVQESAAATLSQA
jgi:hypothetical protein